MVKTGRINRFLHTQNVYNTFNRLQQWSNNGRTPGEPTVIIAFVLSQCGVMELSILGAIVRFISRVQTY
jgi:hypothetical protein